MWPRISNPCADQTRLWHDTWYDSTLPYWFLDRTFLNTSILATSTCLPLRQRPLLRLGRRGLLPRHLRPRLALRPGRGPAVPRLERDTRERVDFGLALKPDGAIHFRGEFNDIPAIDGQAGIDPARLARAPDVADDAFLKRNWPKIKQGDRVADRQGRERRRHHRGQPAQHARHRLVRPGRLAQRPVSGRAAGRRGDGLESSATRSSPTGAARSSNAGRRISSSSSSTANTSSTSPTRNTRDDQLRHRLRDRPGVRPELGVPGRAGPRPAGEGNRARRSSRCGATTSRRMSGPTARPTSPAAGMPWPARPAC